MEEVRWQMGTKYAGGHGGVRRTPQERVLGSRPALAMGGIHPDEDGDLGQPQDSRNRARQLTWLESRETSPLDTFLYWSKSHDTEV